MNNLTFAPKFPWLEWVPISWSEADAEYYVHNEYNKALKDLKFSEINHLKNECKNIEPLGFSHTHIGKTRIIDLKNHELSINLHKRFSTTDKNAIPLVNNFNLILDKLIMMNYRAEKYEFYSNEDIGIINEFLKNKCRILKTYLRFFFNVEEIDFEYQNLVDIVGLKNVTKRFYEISERKKINELKKAKINYDIKKVKEKQANESYNPEYNRNPDDIDKKDKLTRSIPDYESIIMRSLAYGDAEPHGF
jgi:hypothetical protein